jgi:cytochrome c
MAKNPLLLLLALTAPLGAAENPFLSPPVAEGLHDPMEIAVVPGGDLFVIEREGRVLRVRPSTGGMFEVGRFEVSGLRSNDPDSKVAREEGMLGIAVDPNFERNQWLYIYYSDPVKTLNRLSRFTFKDGRIDRGSELTLIEIPIERDKMVCHMGGSLAFGPEGLLYLSTGDNTNPFESEGFSPIDNRPDRTHWDAQRSSGNTNDLRGKILRIRPTEKGYEIPEGNLFPVGTEKTRPEIYVMGCRNPFRISIDPTDHSVYWGEVGPDADKAGPRGARGHDEVNRAAKAGNFGWPYLVANNMPYPIVDFATGQPGAMTDPAAPKNPGIRNTGLADLPPAQPAFIWYPYGESAEFPVMGTGSRNAMAGPVFYYDPSRKNNLFPESESGTLLTYDWARGKILKVRLHDKGTEGGKDRRSTPKAVEKWIEGAVHPMDMEAAPDGTVWLLEYGTNWWFNKDGRIRSLRTDGNRPPVIEAGEVAGQAGQYEVKNVTDPDGDKFTLRWFLTVGTDERDLGSERAVTIQPGEGSELRAVATDAKGAVSIKRFSLGESTTMPPLKLVLPAKPESLGFEQVLKFDVSATNLDAKHLAVRARYIPPTGHDAGGPQFSDAIHETVKANLCLACHQVDQTSVGPRYVDIALRYRDRSDAAAYLKERLSKGSAGSWGEVAMPPQTIKEKESEAVIQAILALADGITVQRGVSQGELKLPAAPKSAAPGGAWEISAEAPGYLPARLRVSAK